MTGQMAEPSALTTAIADYIAAATRASLPEEVRAKTRHHILDTIAAIVSGSRLPAGRQAAQYVSRAGGAGEATVLGTALRVPAEQAALANGMAGHGDETDDSHLAGRFHPGCAIVPAALAVGEYHDSDGPAFLNAVALGYDIGARSTMSLGFRRPDTTKHSTHSLAGNFGAAAAAAVLLGFTPRQVRHVLSYAAQQASGVPFWNRDGDHVEKAFDFGGMGARNGVAAAMMVASGCTAVDDPFSGPHNYFATFGENPKPEMMADSLGTRFEIMQASIKKWCVGSPIQAILDATVALVKEHDVMAGDLSAVRIIMPDDRIFIVNDRDMPDICAQHLTALAILDGTVTFTACHDVDRMQHADVRALRKIISLEPSAELTAAVPARQAIVEMTLKDGRVLRHHAKAVRGTPDNPMTAQEIEDKARDLLDPVIGARRGEAVCAAVARLGTEEGRGAVRAIAALLRQD